MKKLLLSMAVLLGAFTMSAAPVTVDFSNAENLPATESETATSATIGGVDFSFVNCKKGTYNKVSYLQISGKNFEGNAYMEFKTGFAVEKITLHTGSNASTNVTVQLYANDVAVGDALKLGTKDADFTIAIPAASQTAGTTYKLATTNKYNAQITTLTFNGDGQVVEPPVVETKKAANIEAFLTAADAENPTEITSPVTAVYQNGRYLYVTDATGNLLVYGDLDTKYNNGDVIPAGITGKYQNFSEGLLQMSSVDKATFKAGTAGAAVQPEELLVEDIATDMVNQYVLLKNVTITKAEAANTYTMSDETGEIALYNTFYNAQYYTVVEVLEGSDMNVEGFVSVHSGVAQITPVRVWNASGLEAVATPVFNPASGTVAAGTEVTISCATEGAKIYYTLDNSTPSAESTPYTTAIVVNETTHIRAIAVKEGMNNSAIADGNYTVEAPIAREGDAFFNFTKASTLTPAIEEPVSGNPNQAINIDDIDFTDNGATVCFTAGTSASRMWYDFNKGPQARLYKTGKVTVTAPAENSIVKVVFSGENVDYLSVGGTAIENGTWTNANGESVVVFENTGDGRVDFYTIAVYFLKSGVENIGLDQNAPVEYYNLQGVRVENPANGLYIRRQGNNVSKVVL